MPEPAADEPQVADREAPAREPTREPTRERTREPTPRQTGRQRLWQALVKPSPSQFVVALLLAAVGFFAVTQVRTNELDNEYAGYREQDLIDVLTGLSDASQNAERELARLESTRRDLRSVTSRQEAALTEAQQSLETYQVLAGLVEVTGPGIRMTIEETDGQVTLSTMIDLVQELRNAGAEAIAINDEVRVVAQTSFEEVAGGFEAGGKPISAPYTLDVIGDPEALRGGIVFLTGPEDQLEDDGAEVEIEEFSSLDITVVRDQARPDFAEPDEPSVG